MNVKLLALLITGIWIGMLIGISFVEAPLKFQAPNITLGLGLGIGRLVFGVLNKFEIVFSILLFAWLILQYKQLPTFTIIAFALIFFMVTLQSLWLLPVLDKRAEAVIQGLTVSHSNHHFYYVGMELTKVTLLIIGFVKTYQYVGHS